jgi:hypothetical protein
LGKRVVVNPERSGALLQLLRDASHFDQQVRALCVIGFNTRTCQIR